MSPNRMLPPPALAIQRWLLFVSALGLALVLIVVYQWGFDRGTKTGALDFARRAECRATLAVPINEATNRQRAAFGDGMVAGLLRDDPVIVKRIRALTGKDPRQVLDENALIILDEDAAIRREQAKQGDPVKRCKDGKP